jgi:hypothetical protein
MERYENGVQASRLKRNAVNPAAALPVDPMDVSDDSDDSETYMSNGVDGYIKDIARGDNWFDDVTFDGSDKDRAKVRKSI